MDAKVVSKVGMVVLLALVLFGGLYIYLSHFNPNSYTVKVTFDNTKGLGKQSVVRMQGVTIGEVTDITLDTTQRPMIRPVVTLAIRKEVNIPTNYEFAIVSGLLITTAQVEVHPPKNEMLTASNSLPKDGTAQIQGEKDLGPLASFSPELADTLTNLNQSFGGMSKKLDTTFTKVNKTLDNVQPILKSANTLLATTNEAAKAAKDIIASPKTKQDLQATMSNFKQLSENAKLTSQELSASLREITEKTKGPLEKLPSKLNDVLSHVDSTLDNADTVVNKLTEQVTDPRFQQSLQETAELAKTTLARFNQIATDLHELTGDPKLQNDLKLTVENLRITTEKSQQVVDKFNNLLGKFIGTDGGSKTKLRLPHVEVTTSLSEQFAPTRLRLDVDARFAVGNRSSLHFGLYDLGQNTRLNLQAGSQLTDSLTARYGLYGSKLGVGVDYYPLRGTQFRADLWDTSRPRLDLRSSFEVNKNASVWIGAEGIFRRPVPVIGVQFKN